MMNTKPVSPTERREYPQVREIFLQACALLAPIVAANEQVKTFSNFAMAHMVQDHFPSLSSSEVHIVIVNVEKMHREKRLHALLNKKS